MVETHTFYHVVVLNGSFPTDGCWMLLQLGLQIWPWIKAKPWKAIPRPVGTICGFLSENVGGTNLQRRYTIQKSAERYARRLFILQFMKSGSLLGFIAIKIIMWVSFFLKLLSLSSLAKTPPWTLLPSSTNKALLRSYFLGWGCGIGGGGWGPLRFPCEALKYRKPPGHPNRAEYSKPEKVSKLFGGWSYLL